MTEKISFPTYRDTLERGNSLEQSSSAPQNALNRRRTTSKPPRPRLNTLQAPSSASPYKIASSYHLHDEPTFQPMSPSDSEEYELEDTKSSDEEHGISRDMQEAFISDEARPRRKSTFAELFTEPMPAPPEHVATVRRKSTVRAVKDDHIICWSGQDDPERPTNWPLRKKWIATVLVSLFTLMAPVTSSMIAPCLAVMSKDLGVTKEIDQTLMLSLFILAFAFGPLLFGPMSEIFGRVPVLQATNAFYLVFNLACGFAQNGTQMMVFRFLSGLGGSAPSSVGGGVLGDCWKAEQRGKAVAAYSLAPLIGPAIGPIAGGYIASNVSWRWVFWASSIADAVIQLVGIFYLQETYGPKLLHTKAKRLRQSTGNNTYRSEYELSNDTLPNKLATSMVRPFRLIATQPIIQALALYQAYIYGLTFIVYATFPTLWTGRYGQSMGTSGLHYIALSVGYALGTQLIAPLNDRVYHRLKQRNQGVGKPEFRCVAMLPGALIVISGLFWYGWSAQAKLFWLMPDIGIAIFAVGVDIGFQCTTAYLIDCYTRYAASAIAAAVLLRSFCGFGFPLFANVMYDKLGYGWGNSVLGFVAITLGIPAPFALWKWGPALRHKSKYAAGD